jgi:hypothetical protein
LNGGKNLQDLRDIAMELSLQLRTNSGTQVEVIAFWPLLLSCPDAIRPSKIGKPGLRADSRAREDDEIFGFEHPMS